MREEEASEWMRGLKANVDALCFEAVGVSVDNLRGVEWLNKVGREAREGNVILDMQGVDNVKTVRGLIENPKCMWLLVDVGGGGWAPCDTPVVMNDGYAAAGALEELGVAASGAGRRPVTPQLVLPLGRVAEELGTLWSDDDADSGSDVDMGSSPLAARAGRRLRVEGRGRDGPLVEPVVLFPAVPVLPSTMRGLPRAGSVPDSVDGGESDLGEDLEDAVGGGYD